MKNLFTGNNNKRIAAMLLVTLMTAAMAGCTSAVTDETVSDAAAKQEVLSTSTQADGEYEAATPAVDREAVHDEEETIVADNMTAETVGKTIVYEPVNDNLQDSTEASLDGGIAAIGIVEDTSFDNFPDFTVA
ncbi:MAG: hypothetical protein LUE87_09770 [Lachnospiraceae bacterium]|nr:hypothetical protein [Lachnospiraceae bacterium]